MATICSTRACPQCGETAYFEERFNGYDFTSCPVCGFSENAKLIATANGEFVRDNKGDPLWDIKTNKGCGVFRWSAGGEENVERLNGDEDIQELLIKCSDPSFEGEKMYLTVWDENSAKPIFLHGDRGRVPQLA